MHGLAPGNQVYLAFTTGARRATCKVATVPTNSMFTATTSDSTTRSGNCLIPKLSGGGYTQRGTNITISIAGTHGLNVGDIVYVNFMSGSATSGILQCDERA